MRILFLASYFPRPARPQIGTWALEQAKALARVAEVEAVCCTPWLPGLLRLHAKARPWVEVPRRHRWDNVPVEYVKMAHYPVFPLKAWVYPDPEREMFIAWQSARARLLEAVERIRPDGILAHHTGVNGYLAERLHVLTGVPYIVSDYEFLEVAACARYPERRRMFARIIRTARANICASRRMEADMKRIFPFARTHTIHQAIAPHAPEIFTTPRPEPLRGKQVIFTAAMFNARKGVPLLMEAFSRIAPKHPQARLRIAGDGPDRPEVEAALARLPLNGQAELLGVKTQQEVIQEMAWADAFALVSWDEPFATVFLEAMAAGCPVLTASDGGINDIVRDRVHGLVVPPKDVGAAAEALDYLLSHPEEAQRMGAAGRALTGEMTWDATARRIVGLFGGAA